MRGLLSNDLHEIRVKFGIPTSSLDVLKKLHQITVKEIRRRSEGVTFQLKVTEGDQFKHILLLPPLIIIQNYQS